jgi:hypothetical protein
MAECSIAKGFESPQNVLYPQPAGQNVGRHFHHNSGLTHACFGYIRSHDALVRSPVTNRGGRASKILCHI